MSMAGVEEALPKVEGLTPTILWYTLVGVVGICALIILYDKVEEVFRKRKQRKQNAEAEHDGTIQGQLDKMNRQIAEIQKDLKTQFAEYDRKFATDKEMLDMHTRQINTQQAHIEQLFSGQKATCRGILALLNHEITGNSVDKLKAAKERMEEYLIDGAWPEEQTKKE